jgi:hypothetical protein
MPLRLAPLSTCVALALVSAGCWSSGPEIAYVTGKVTMDGKPLPNVTVVFVPPNGRPSGAQTDANGEYVLNFSQGRSGAMPGKNMVRFTTLRDGYEDESGKKIPGSKETIPPHYNGDSQLTFDVEPNKRNVANFELVSGPPPKAVKP